MARYRKVDGARYIEGGSGYGWSPDERPGAWFRDEGGVRYVLHKRARNVKDETYDTGWYLYDTKTNGFFGEWCATLLLEAVDEADTLIREAEKESQA